MITTAEYRSRCQGIQDRCRADGLDAFLVTSDDNLYYFTGKSCMPFERPFVLILWADKAPTYLIPRLEREHMAAIAHIDDFATYDEYPAKDTGTWSAVLGDLLSGCRKIGTDLFTRSEIFHYLSHGKDVVPYDWAYVQRYTKSAEEIRLMKAVAGYTKDAMAAFIRGIRFGSIALDSLEPARKAQQKALIDRKFDVDYFAMKFQSAGWPAPKSAEPHSIPNILMPFEDGPHVFILSNRLDGYAIELERTFFTSRPTLEMKEYFGHMLKAREIALSLCRSGTAAAEVDRAARDYLHSQGFKDNVIHRTGHGMGVSNHEGPFLAVGSPTVLEPGMTLTVEPGLYFTGLGAFRHSDTILITEDGYETLTEYPTDLGSLTITRKRGFKSRLKTTVLNRMVR